MNGCNFAETLVGDPLEPSTISQAWSSEYSHEWRQATDDEFSSLLKMGTWQLVDKPSNVNVVGCKWVFKVKRKSDNSIDLARWKGKEKGRL